MCFNPETYAPTTRTRSSGGLIIYAPTTRTRSSERLIIFDTSWGTVLSLSELNVIMNYEGTETQSKGSHRGLVESLQCKFEAHSEHQCVFHGGDGDDCGLAARPEGHHHHPRARDPRVRHILFRFRARKPFPLQCLQ